MISYLRVVEYGERDLDSGRPFSIRKKRTMKTGIEIPLRVAPSRSTQAGGMTG
jgi:hypothetical protein